MKALDNIYITEGNCKNFEFVDKRQQGYVVAQLVGTLHYKTEGRGFESRFA